MKSNQEIRDELEKMSPFLAGMEKKQAFQLPPRYFEQMQEEVFQQIREETTTEKAPSPSASWIDRLAEQLLVLFQPRYVVGFASIAILLVAGIYLLQTTSNIVEGQGIEMADLSIEETQEYITNNIDDFDTDLLSEIVTSEELAFDEVEIEEDSDLYLEEIINDLDDSELEELL